MIFLNSVYNFVLNFLNKNLDFLLNENYSGGKSFDTNLY